MEVSKHKEMVPGSIDQLRKRKACSDFERICHMLERKHGLTTLETEEHLDKLVKEGSVIRMDYKWNTSYRHAATWKKNHPESFSSDGTVPSGAVADTIHRAIEERQFDELADQEVDFSSEDGGVIATPGCSGDGGRILGLSKTNSAAGGQRRAIRIAGVSLEDGNSASLLKSSVSKQSFQVNLLEKETESGRITRNADGSYSLFDPTFLKPVVKPVKTTKSPKSVTPPLAQASGTDSAGKPARERIEQSMTVKATREPTKAKSPKSVTPPMDQAVDLTAEHPPRERIKPLILKKGRPPTKRKRIKKTHGPDFEQYDVIRTENRCDYCLLTAESNLQGEQEALLICKDCNAKAHPACMNYSSHLAERARFSPWQCIDCKTCYICTDAGDPDAMLFCDACDKGYHMTCHIPSVTEKPTGKWMCSTCERETVSEMEGLRNQYIEPYSSQLTAGIVDAGASCLPTPSASPVPSMEGVPTKLARVETKTPVKRKRKSKVVEKPSFPNPSFWSIEDVANYLSSIGFADQADKFKEQEIDGQSLLLMRRGDVLSGLSIKLGPALKIFSHIYELQANTCT